MKIGLLSTLNAHFLGYILREFLQTNLHIEAVLLDSKDITEKDQKLHEERTGDRMPTIPLEEFEKAHVPFYFVKNHNSKTCAELVEQLGIDILINGGTPRILKSEILRAPTLGVLNCHPGLLPNFRGCTCVEWAVYLDKQVGNTLHFMSERIDEGPIIIQEALMFEKTDKYVDVRTKVHMHGFELMVRGVRKIIDEELTPEDFPQQGEGIYYPVIDDEKMTVVMTKLEEGTYKYQVESCRSVVTTARR